MVSANLSADINKFQGVILGAAVGDALGWPQEDRARRTSGAVDQGALFESWTKRSGGRFQPHEEKIEAGSYSDDTQLLIAVARCRLRDDWLKHLAFVEFPFWILYQRGAGGASLRAASLLSKHVLPWESPEPDRNRYFDAGGNGVAMRIAPHCLIGCMDADFSTTAANVMADGVLTHGHPTALVGALAYAYALWTALRKTGTLEYGQLLEVVRSSSDEWSAIPSISERWPTWEGVALTGNYRDLWDQSVKEIHRQLEVSSAGLVTGALDFDDEILESIGCFNKKVSGAGTVSAAASIFLSSKYAVSPMEGVARAAYAKGADTDTIASMTGAIAGAINGTTWLSNAAQKLQDQKFLMTLARMLFDRVQGLKLPYLTVTTQVHSVLSSLSRGENVLTLPTGTSANVIGDGGVVSKAEKLQANSWKLRDENGQTFVIKQFKKRPKYDPQTEQRHLELEISAGSHGRFAGISLFARDLEQSRHFYSDLLGLPVKRDTGSLVALGEHLVLRRNDIVRMTGEGSIVYVDVDNINRCWQNIRVLKFAQASSIERKSNRSSFTCKDPDGRIVEVFQR